ncbi:MAG: polysaccharide deacetylase family protein [bacterium]
MRPIFKNGATRARAMAWVGWLGFVGFMAALWWLTLLLTWIRLCLLLAFGLGTWLILVRRWPRKIPVLNYHSVSACPEWLQIADQVSLTPAAFECQLSYLAKQGYRTLFVSEVNQALTGKLRLLSRGRYVALTFDDGYADNWMAVFPLLRKYGMKATLFVSTGFVAEALGCRPTIEQNECAKWGSLDWSGYLTWPELKAMQASGLVEIQSHGEAHTQVFVEPELKGFIGPGKPNLWMLWNALPEMRRQWWHKLAEDRSLWGQPVFRQGPALAHRAYRPAPEAVARFLSWVGEAGGAIFDKPDWEARLREEWQRRICDPVKHGSMEEPEAYVRRVLEDLGRARETLERKLRTKVEVLCWPENAFSPEGEAVARRLGYRATVSNRHNSRNVTGEAPGMIVRTFIGCRAAGIRSQWLDFAAFVLELKVFEGWYLVYPFLAVMHQARKWVFALRRHCLCRRDYVSIWA